MIFFIIRKVIAPQGMIRAAGMLMKALAAWLVKKGYVRAEGAQEQGAAAVRDLPRAEKVATLFQVFCDMQARGDEDDETEDHFEITRVGPKRIWLEPAGEHGKASPSSSRN